MPTTPKHRPLWNSDLSVGSRDLDTHHRHLGLLVNRLADTPPGPGGRFLAHDVLRELAAYAAYHFELEEALMASVRFPGLAAHQTEHLQFCEVVAEAGYGAALGVIDHAELVAYLIRWWHEHFRIGDQQYAPYLALAGDRSSPARSASPMPHPTTIAQEQCHETESV